MKSLAAGPDGNLYPGQTYSLDDQLAESFVSGCYAEYIDELQPENAPAETSEHDMQGEKNEAVENQHDPETVELQEEEVGEASAEPEPEKIVTQKNKVDKKPKKK